MSVLARKYNLTNPNVTGNLEKVNKTPLKKDVGRILPESVGADKSLFEDTPVIGEQEHSNAEILNTQSPNRDAQLDDHSSLNIHLTKLDSDHPSLDMSMLDNDYNTTDQDENSPTSFQSQSVPDTTSL